MKLFCLLRLLLCSAVLSAGTVAVGEVPIGETSSWKKFGEGDGGVEAAARDGTALLLSGRGSGLTGDGGRAVLFHQTESLLWRTGTSITAKLVSLTGAGGTPEAGIRMEVRPSDVLFSPGIGMRLIYSTDGTLRSEGKIYTYEVTPPPPATGLTLPLYLRVEWDNGGLRGLYSQDGVTWTAVSGWLGWDEGVPFEAGSALPVTLPPVAYPALMVSSRGNAQAAEARFDEVTICGGDADENGIADGWEKLNFGRLIGADASADSDRDGMTNRDEWLWNKNPHKQDAKPQLVAEPLPDGKLRLVLEGYESNGMVGFYGTFQTAASPTGPWTDEPHWLIGDWHPPLYLPNWTVIPAPGHYFYRVKANIPFNDPLMP